MLLMLQSLLQFLLVPGVPSLLVRFQGASKFDLLLLFLFALPWMMSHASISVSTNKDPPSRSFPRNTSLTRSLIGGEAGRGKRRPFSLGTTPGGGGLFIAHWKIISIHLIKKEVFLICVEGNTCTKKETSNIEFLEIMERNELPSYLAVTALQPILISVVLRSKLLFVKTDSS